jgi:hypothetical protein
VAFTEVVIGVDAGTSAIKTGVVTLDGRLLALETAHTACRRRSRAPPSRTARVVGALVATLRRAVARLEGMVRPIAVAIGGQAPRSSRPMLGQPDGRPSLARPASQRAGRSDLCPPGRARTDLGIMRRRRPGSPAYPQAKRTTRWYLGCPDYLAARLTLTPSFCYHVRPAEIEAAELGQPRGATGGARSTARDRRRERRRHRLAIGTRSSPGSSTACWAYSEVALGTLDKRA